MSQHVNLICRSVVLELRTIWHFRRQLSVDATKKLVLSFVLSRLDYWSSLLEGLHENRLDRLQRVQNYAARLVLCRRGRYDAKPLLRSTHWLPIRALIEYMISTLCYRNRDSSAPAYLSDHLSINHPAICVPRIKLSKYGKCVFSDQWLGLPSPNLCGTFQDFHPSSPI